MHAEIIPYPKFNIDLAVTDILNRFQWYKERYLYLSKRISENIGDFLKIAEESLSFIHLIAEESTLFHDNINVQYCESKKEIVELRPEQILNSGYDIAVYGAAGAGKTTTLSNFAISKAKREKNSVIYIPLNRVVEIYKKLCTSSKGKTTEEKSHEDLLVDDPDNAIFICILISKEILFNSKNLELVKLAITHEKTLIIDGLDEAYDAIPHILPSVNKFKKNHRCQIIISSRDCVKYLNEIDFLGITLLPFTKAQLLSFVDKWFSDCERKIDLLEKIESSDLYKEISSPLLAT
ncbi:MAG: hypothetical protein KKE30_07515, partial [Gammaproteobacteria bacterium]|nr:hypothetical protein [Gammaproteobacteria bacterium]MBU1553606.1 hypothetical protein [Gammaproteobacteria bacterium]